MNASASARVTATTIVASQVLDEARPHWRAHPPLERDSLEAVEPEAFLDRWHRIVRERDMPALASVLAPEIELGAPPYWEPFRGAPLCHHLLGLILETIEDFRYHREWTDGRELALEFTGQVGELKLQGIDLITLDREGRILRLDVLMRPVNSVHALIAAIGPQMAEFLAKQKG
jgi:hypothetical protein